MSLVPSLLQAIVKVDGEAMVMHAGDKPYVVSPTGQVELATRGLTLEAVNGIVGQLLPAEIQTALEEFGAIQYELPSLPEFPSEQFTVVAARGGDDVWVEIRRRRAIEEDRVPEEMLPPPVAPPIAAAVAAPAAAAIGMPAQAAMPPAAVAAAHAPQLDAIAAQPAAPVMSVVSEPLRQAAPQVAARADIDDEGEEINLDDDFTLPDETQLFGAPVAPFTDSDLGEGREQEIDLDGLDVEVAIDEPEPAPVAVAGVPPPVEPAFAAPAAELLTPPAVEAFVEPIGEPAAEAAAEIPEAIPEIPEAIPEIPEAIAEVAPPTFGLPDIEEPIANTPPRAVFVIPALEEAIAREPMVPAAAIEIEPAAAFEPAVVEISAPPLEPVATPTAEVAPPPVETFVEAIAAHAPYAFAEVASIAPSFVADIVRPAEPLRTEEIAPQPDFAAPAAIESLASQQHESFAPPPPELIAAREPEPVAAPGEPIAPPPAVAAEPRAEIHVANMQPHVDAPAAQPTANVEPSPAQHRDVAARQPRAVPPAAPPPQTPAVTPPVAPPLSAYGDEHDDIAAWPQAVVLPISRSPIRGEQPAPLLGDATMPGLDRLLRLAAARGASTLYLSSESRPSMRVDGELHAIDPEPVHTARDVESLLLTLMPERNHEALRSGAQTEWICDIEGVGRVRCMSFRDHRGPGGVFRLMPTRSVSVEQLGLPRHVQSLAIEPSGLVLIAGPRSSGKRTLMAAFVDLMNRTRRDHIITIEREINIVQDGGHSFISQREVRGGDDDMVAAARAALREDPDVLVIEDLRTGPLMNVALEASAAGRLVVGGFSAHTAAGAIDRIIDLYAPEYRRQVQMSLAESLRGVVVQVLLRKIGGGRLPAREVLLNTAAVSSVIAEGKTSQLPMAIEGGRRYGMVPLNDALVGLVQSGAVDAREAYRQSPDRPGFLAAMTRHGLDTSFVERFA